MLYKKMKQMADKSAEKREKIGRYARKRMEKLFTKKAIEQTIEIIDMK